MPFRVNDKPLVVPPVGLTQDAGEAPFLRTHAFMEIAEMQFLLVEGGNEDSPPLRGHPHCTRAQMHGGVPASTCCLLCHKQ